MGCCPLKSPYQFFFLLSSLLGILRNILSEFTISVEVATRAGEIQTACWWRGEHCRYKCRNQSGSLNVFMTILRKTHLEPAKPQLKPLRDEGFKKADHYIRIMLTTLGIRRVPT
mmetsp:Transcript_14027/g.16998  ORF Transcript_14027/g.16998 Transcript_14027/m.16998 type:complete len:114 (-) Transcript_14027:194-535(-)